MGFFQVSDCNRIDAMVKSWPLVSMYISSITNARRRHILYMTTFCSNHLHSLLDRDKAERHVPSAI
jgi:hypothetical protein